MRFLFRNRNKVGVSYAIMENLDKVTKPKNVYIWKLGKNVTKIFSKVILGILTGL